ncbi:MAG: tRNA (adenosine(37)-N6)-dimethylallyltransferase MiaA [Chitinivibrionales bacterium]|nr:tRNA (adenosine(37)-N6)-dimethylallyltransferase MiaA [Chitinivibrionales bacterium]
MKQSANLLVVCGPNASGKTKLGVQLAYHSNAEIISADSRQVYKKMDIGTGKDLNEYTTPQGTVPFHLIDIVSPDQMYTLYHYQRDFYCVFREIHSRKKLPLLVGGTGLYIEAVLKHYKIPNVPENRSLRKNLMKKSTSSLLSQLSSLDPGLLHQTDTTSKKRIVRGIEIALYGREHPIEWGCRDHPEIKPLVLGIHLERKKLHTKIETRLAQRFREGMIQEVEQLKNNGISPERFSLFGMEYKYIGMYLDGRLSYDDMYQQLTTSIYHLAKRQETWFRGMERRGIPVHWLEDASFDKALNIIKNYNFLR